MLSGISPEISLGVTIGIPLGGTPEILSEVSSKISPGFL